MSSSGNVQFQKMLSSGFGFLTIGDVGVKHHPRNSGRNSPKSTKICNREQKPRWCYKQCWQKLPGCWGGSFSAPEIPSCPHLEGFKGQLRTSIQFFSTWCRFLKPSAGCSDPESFPKPLNSFVTVQILLIPCRVQQRGHCCTKLFTDTRLKSKNTGLFLVLFRCPLGTPGDWNISGSSQFIPAGLEQPSLFIVPEPPPDTTEIHRRMEFGPTNVICFFVWCQVPPSLVGLPKVE